jgi:hypothetical protein
MKNVKPILIGASSGILVVVLYLTAMNFYTKSYYKRLSKRQGVVEMYFYEVEDKISTKHYPINIDSLRHFVLDSNVNPEVKMDSLRRLSVIVNHYLEK